MKQPRFLGAIMAGVFILAVSIAMADVPQMINYHGRLTKPNGQPVADGPYLIEFVIYDAPTNGNELWNSTQQTVQTSDGLFEIRLGEWPMPPIPDTIFNTSPDRWLGITVETDSEIEPRTRFTSVGYAYHALRADTAGFALSPNNGWVDDGGVVRLTDETDQVGIGTDSPSQQLEVEGHVRITGKAIIGQGCTSTGSHPFVAGYNNTVSGDICTVSGGENNAASDLGTTVSGGVGNTANTTYATVCGGHGNLASGGYSVICGGEWDTVSGTSSVIVCGERNKITESGYSSSILGGNDNTLHCQYSAILGGATNTIAESDGYSMVFGTDVYVESPFRVVFFNSSPTTSGRFGLNRDDNDGGIDHPIHVGTSTSNGNGAFLSEDGIWTDATRRDSERNAESINGGQLLAKVADLSINFWQHEDSDARHIGPVASEFVGTFDVGVIGKDGVRDVEHLAASDVAGVALAAVKELTRENLELRELIEELRREVDEIRSR